MEKLKFKIRRYTDAYLSSFFILLIDVFFSLAASAGALFIAHFLFPIQLSTHLIFLWMSISLISSLFFFWALKTYQIIIRHSTIRDIWKFSICGIGKFFLITFVMLSVFWNDTTVNGISIVAFLDAALTFCFLVVVRAFMVVTYDFVKRKWLNVDKNCQRILIYGIGDKSVSLVMRLQNSPHYRVVGFLVPKEKSHSYKIAEHTVFHFSNDQDDFLSDCPTKIDAILFAHETDAQKEQDRMIKFALYHQKKILFAPPIDEAVNGKLPAVQGIREIKIEDLLGRPEIKISMNEIMANFKGKTVLITGAAGSIGSELCRQLATFGVKKLVLYDNAETPMHNLRLELENKFPELSFLPIIGDIRMTARLDAIFAKHRPQVVFHAAAYKHVPLMEENPCEAVYVNVIGTRNVADNCITYGVEKMVMISTDKAVNPTNIMGCTKRLAEIYVQSLGLAVEKGKVEGRTKFVTTRFGNVLGSNGSVVPRFREQIANGGPVTVTHPDITRFFMTIPEACRLVMEAATMSSENQICVFDMGESVKISQLAKRMIELAGFKVGEDIKIEYTGLRPGEKLYEEVLANTENTLPTSHERIRIAKVREYNYESAKILVERLGKLLLIVDIPNLVRLMKKAVPEFKSQHSIYEKYDKELELEHLQKKNIVEPEVKITLLRAAK